MPGVMKAIAWVANAQLKHLAQEVVGVVWGGAGATIVAWDAKHSGMEHHAHEDELLGRDPGDSVQHSVVAEMWLARPVGVGAHTVWNCVVSRCLSWPHVKMLCVKAPSTNMSAIAAQDGGEWPGSEAIPS